MNENFYSKKLICPICKSHFQTTKIKSEKVKIERKDTDLFRYFKSENPYFYEINVCPSCGFSYSDNFNQELDTAAIGKFLKTVSLQWKKQDYTGKRNVTQAIETYKLALLTAQTIDLNENIIASILLRISWLNRLIGNSNEEKRFMKGAVDFFEKTYSTSMLHSDKSMSSEMMVYLLGELNYRLGQYDESIKWFNIGITKYARSPYAKKQTIDMMRNRWMDIKEEMKNQTEQSG